MQRHLVVVAVLVLLIGIAWPWLARLPTGRLPGDVHLRGDGWSVAIPIATCLVAGALLTLLVWLIRR